MFSRIAIVNRGEPAIRFIRALREYNLERETFIQGIAFFTQPDEQAPFVRQADEAVDMGEALRTQPNGSSLSAYCDHDWVLHLLQNFSSAPLQRPMWYPQAS